MVVCTQGKEGGIEFVKLTIKQCYLFLVVLTSIYMFYIFS